jgi:hypothetical protein
VRVSINIRLVSIGLVILVDGVHGTGMEHIASAPAKHLHDSSELYCCDCQCRLKRTLPYSLSVYVDNNIKTNLVHLFLQVKKKNT